jgi:succinoglycan biosynthesis transport protein ExoP
VPTATRVLLAPPNGRLFETAGSGGERTSVELRERLAVLRKRWVTVLTITLLALAVSIAVTLTATPEYRATTRLFFSVQSGESVSDLAQGSSFTERQMSSYARVATSPLVLDPVIDQLDLDLTPEELARSLVATVPINTVILEISATSADPEEAVSIANLVGARVASTVGSLTPERPDGTQAVRATTLTPARVPQRPSSPEPLKNIVLGLLLGLGIGAGTAMVRNSLDTKIRSEADVGAVTDRPVLGEIAFDGDTSAHPLVMLDHPTSARAESVRRLRTNLQYVDMASGPRSIVVTSSVPNEGKTTTAANLALSLADAGNRVVLVDADFRKPSIAALIGIEGAVGLTAVLIGRAELREVVQPIGTTSLDVLAAGEIPPNPSELLGSQAMRSVLEALTAEYEIVLLDTAPLLPVTDAAVLAKVAGGTLVIADARRIRKPELAAALDTLSRVDAHVLGIVLNKVTAAGPGGYGYGYGYGRVVEDKRQ